MSPATLKRYCSRIKIQWPYRQIQAIFRRVQSLRIELSDGDLRKRKNVQQKLARALVEMEELFEKLGNGTPIASLELLLAEALSSYTPSRFGKVRSRSECLTSPTIVRKRTASNDVNECTSPFVKNLLEMDMMDALQVEDSPMNIEEASMDDVEAANVLWSLSPKPCRAYHILDNPYNTNMSAMSFVESHTDHSVQYASTTSNRGTKTPSPWSS